jgi:iron complex transport system substrate-binding protein
MSFRALTIAGLMASVALPVTAAEPTVYPVTIDNCGTELVIPAAPQKVITLDTSLAETLVALGVSDRIVGTYFDFKNGGIDPENRTVLDGLTVLGEGGYPSREAVITLGPDFLLAFGESDFSQEGAPSREDLAGIGTTIYRSEAFGCEEGQGTIESSFGEILDLGVIFDKQAEAEAIVEGMRSRLQRVEDAVAGAERPSVIFWDAYDVENIRLLPFGYFQDAVARAGGEILFADVTDAAPVSKEQIATSEVDIVLAIDYGPETTTPLLPAMRELVKNTPAGARGEASVVAVTNYPPNLQSVSLVEAIAAVLHPDLVD